MVLFVSSKKHCCSDPPAQQRTHPRYFKALREIARPAPLSAHIPLSGCNPVALGRWGCIKLGKSTDGSTNTFA